MNPPSVGLQIGPAPGGASARSGRAVGDAPYEADESRDIRFCLPDEDGRERWLRRDEILLRPTTPAAWPRP